MASNLKRVTATGNATAGEAYLKSLVLTGGSAASSVEVRDGSGGAVLLTLKAAIDTTVPWTSGDARGAFFGETVHLTLAGTGAEVTAEVE